MVEHKYILMHFNFENENLQLHQLQTLLTSETYAYIGVQLSKQHMEIMESTSFGLADFGNTLPALLIAVNFFQTCEKVSTLSVLYADHSLSLSRGPVNYFQYV